MPSSSTSSKEFARRLDSHPALKARMESILNLVEGVGNDVKKADEAERQAIEELRRMGNEVLTDWASQRLVRSEEELRVSQPKVQRSGEKNFIGTLHLEK
ncbi:hypothetical protein [Candidatus Venteria ishoeyi]|uniref:Uncharacterized protein n=1 Tax=Candidatus Venteria ishoeyi TaxID=1899563 RepID=A0A1H6F6I5_9GAMM|nr:hypothetical protein [Candidatus Venteria ishoeyi]SEH05758.1 Uncharacterised protein [Candidatus Venteria ishoeyi]